KDHQPIQAKGNLQRAVAQQYLFRCATFVANMNQIEIAKHPVENKRDSKHHGVVLRQSVSQKGIKAVGHNGTGRDNTLQPVNEIEIVIIENGAMVAGGSAQQCNLRPPLAQSHEKSQKTAKDIE